MAAEQSGAFTDNWSYLKTELSWLERVLMVAIARQKKETKEIDRIAQSRADRATSHWWKGVIATDGQGVHDEHRKPTEPGKPAYSYSQQLEARIIASRKNGVVLALPLLRDRLQLTPFEKNVLLMSLAPEVNRRFARLYRFLQNEEGAGSLPTVDLALRILCKDDKEWRVARTQLFCESPLIRHALVDLLPRPFEGSLSHTLRLSEAAIAYLLSESPTETSLSSLLTPATLLRPVPMTKERGGVEWHDLLLPAPLLNGLQVLGSGGGGVFVLAGPVGTGKRTAAKAIAHNLGAPLISLDLATVLPEDHANVLQALENQNPAVLLIQSAECWLRRSALLPAAEVQRFLTVRRSTALTLLSVTRPEAIALPWQQQFNGTFAFAVPSVSDRLQLWQRFIPAETPIAANVDWSQIARTKLTGGEIQAIAQAALALWNVSGETVLGRSHLQQAFVQQGKTWRSVSAKNLKP